MSALYWSSVIHMKRGSLKNYLEYWKNSNRQRQPIVSRPKQPFFSSPLKSNAGLVSAMRAAQREIRLRARFSVVYPRIRDHDRNVGLKLLKTESAALRLQPMHPLDQRSNSERSTSTIIDITPEGDGPRRAGVCAYLCTRI